MALHEMKLRPPDAMPVNHDTEQQGTYYTNAGAPEMYDHKRGPREPGGALREAGHQVAPGLEPAVGGGVPPSARLGWATWRPDTMEHVHKSLEQVATRELNYVKEGEETKPTRGVTQRAERLAALTSRFTALHVCEERRRAGRAMRRSAKGH